MRNLDKRAVLLDAAMRRHGYASHALIESLHTAQQSYGFLDRDTVRSIASALRLPPSTVYGVATFYNLFTLKPRGLHTCVVCTGTACYIKGDSALLATIERELSLKPGMTSADNALSLLEARCFGSCAQAPAVAFDGTVIGHNTPARVVARARDLAAGRAGAPV
jgi:bidirectional [NiFe] hydrogenase diaphorase subunit